MEYRRLGKSGLQVSELSFGSWITFGNQIGDNTSEKLMDMAYEAGVNFFDNAEIYATGLQKKLWEIFFLKKAGVEIPIFFPLKFSLVRAGNYLLREVFTAST